MNELPKPPTKEAIAVLQRLLSSSFPGVEQLREQLKGLLVQPLDQEGSLRLIVQNKCVARVAARVPVEGSYSDSYSLNDFEARVRILLHVLDGELFELEVYKDDGTPILRLPDVSELRIEITDCDPPPLDSSM